MRKKFQETIGVFDSLLAKVKQFESDLAKALVTTDKIITTQLEQANSISALSNSLSQVITVHSEQNRDLKQENNQTIEAQKKNFAEISELKGKFTGISNEINVCKAALQTKISANDIPPFGKNIDSLAVTVNENFANVQRKHLDLASDISVLKQAIDEIKKKINANSQKDAEISENLLKVASDVKVCDQKIQASIDQSKSIYRYVDDKVLSMPKPPVQSAEDIKKMMLAAFEPFAIDAKNANLRSANNENKLNVLEKKLEHLGLLLSAVKQG